MAHLVELDTILNMAARLFDSQGYVETTMQDIADRLRISKPTLYRHVKSKSGILQLIIDRWIEQSDRALDAAFALPDSEERIPALVRAWTESTLTDGPSLKVFLADERDMPPRAIRGYHDWSVKVYKRFRQLVGEGQEAGYYRGDADPTVATFTVLGFILLLPRWLNENGPLAPREVAEEFLKTFTKGLRVPATHTEFSNADAGQAGESHRRNIENCPLPD